MNRKFKEWLELKPKDALYNLHLQIDLSFRMLRKEWKQIEEVIGRRMSEWILAICQDSIRMTLTGTDGDDEHMEQVALAFFDEAVDKEGFAAKLS
jgi:hypothetical protein